MPTKVVKLFKGGMFSVVNEVVSQLNLAEKNGYDFVIDGRESIYRDPSFPGDPWNYFFEDCFEGADPEAKEVLPRLGGLTDPSINLMKPRVYENLHRGPMLLPQDRELPHRLICQYLRLKPNVAEVVERFSREHFTGYVIGLHLRGPGRLDGGTKQFKRRHKLKNGVPFELYFGFVDRQLAQHPEARVFVCSDSQMVIDECRLKYGERVLTYSATRSDYGEMHVANKTTGEYSGYKLGEDVVAEAYLLARVDYLVHGNSNVTNFVLCLNPALPSHYVYEADSHERLSLRLLDLFMVRSTKLALAPIKRLRNAAIRTLKTVTR